MVNQPTIFRTNSLERYLKQNDERGSLQLHRPQMIGYMLILLGLMLMGLSLLWFAVFPVYQAVDANPISRGNQLLIAVPITKAVSQLHVEQPVLVRLNGEGPLHKGTFVERNEQTAFYRINALTSKQIAQHKEHLVEVKIQVAQQRLLFLLWPDLAE